MKFLPSLLLMVVFTIFCGNSFASHIFFDRDGAGQKGNSETKVNSYAREAPGASTLILNTIKSKSNIIQPVPLYNCKYSDNSKKIYCLFSKNPNRPTNLTHYVEYSVNVIKPTGNKKCSSAYLNKYNNNYYFAGVVVDNHRLGIVNLDTNRCSDYPITFQFMYRDACNLTVKTTSCIIYNK